MMTLAIAWYACALANIAAFAMDTGIVTTFTLFFAVMMGPLACAIWIAKAAEVVKPKMPRITLYHVLWRREQ